MKEATGELNMTVVTVVAIAAVAAFFYAFVWPGIKSSIEKNTHCANAICDKSNCTGGTCKCTYINENNTTENITCPDASANSTAK